MLVKFHSHGAGDSAGVIDYLLGDDRERDQAKVLVGDVESIRQIIDTTPYARKYTSGVLSFLESDIKDEDKHKLIESFESVLVPGLDKDQYASLWIEHRDKDRLELNFVFANIELQSSKRLQPYYHKVDLARVDAWKNITNADYEFADPNDPARAQLLTVDNIDSKSTRKKTEIQASARNQLIAYAHEGNQLRNRDDVVNALGQLGYCVARQTKQAISIEDPRAGKSGNIRLRGKLFEADFELKKHFKSYKAQASKAYLANRADMAKTLKPKLKAMICKKRDYNQERYPRPAPSPLEPVKNKEKDNDEPREDITAAVDTISQNENDRARRFRERASVNTAFNQELSQRISTNETGERSATRARRSLEQASAKLKSVAERLIADIKRYRERNNDDFSPSR